MELIGLKLWGNGKVYTVEGNSTNDTCRKKEYAVNSQYIFGYGTPSY